MARPAKAKPTRPARDDHTPDDVFDTAVSGPPQAYAKRVPKQGAARAAPPPEGAFSAAPLDAAGSVPAAPWCTCGLGGDLLARNAVLFWVLTGLTYAVGLGVLYYLLLVLYLWWLLGTCGEACAESCDGCTCEGGSSGGGCGDCCCGGSDPEPADKEEKDAPGYGVATGLAGMLAALGLRRLDPAQLAHHPDLPEFAADVWRVRGVRVCVGCSVVYPTFLAAAGILAVLPAPAAWGTMLAAGVGLAGVQAVSALGWTRWRWLKASVKASLGAGLALAMHGVLAAPWPHLVQGGALTAMVALAGLSALPRRRRIQDALDARRDPTDN